MSTLPPQRRQPTRRQLQRQQELQRQQRRRLLVGFVVLVALLAGGAAAYVHYRGNPWSAKTPAPQTTTYAPVAAPTQDLRRLKQAIDSGTVSGQRKAMATWLRSHLTHPMFRPVVHHKRTTVTIDAKSFQSDPEDNSVATVHATLSNGLGSYKLRLIHEQDGWLLVYAMEVKK